MHLHDDHEEEDLPLRRTARSSHGGDKELVLGTGTVLAIFMALVLLCAVFFGFGYTMGRKSMAPATPTESAETSNDDSLSKPKPGAAVTGSATPSPAVPPTTSSLPDPAPAPKEVAKTDTTDDLSAADSKPVRTPVKQEVSPVTAPPPMQHAAAPQPAASAPMPSTTTNGSLMVQIAAVSHPEDADVLTSALRRRGYAVVARNDLGDHLIHVQIGPFANRKDAETMRQRLIGEGYNAFIK